MESYQEWDVTIPSIPPRSRLYPLEPIGIETPYVESLTSYIARLAEEHCVSPDSLIVQEILHWQGLETMDLNTYHRLNNFLNRDASIINGTGQIARQWVDTLQALTLSNNLRFLTMLTFSEVISSNRLLRRIKAWCPRCYEDWKQANHVIYEPLLWALNGINVCPRHQQLLVTLCSNCQRTLPLLNRTARTGYCSHCMCWQGSARVGQTVELTSLDTGEFKQQLWVAEGSGELLAAAPTLSVVPPKEQIASMFRICLDRYAKGNMSILARLLKKSVQRVRVYLDGDVPCFDTLMHLCSVLSITPLELLTLDTIPPERIPPFALDCLPVISESKGKPVTENDVRRMRLALESALTIEEVDSSMSLQNIAQRIGYHVETLRKHCPDLFRAVAIRFRRRWVGNDNLSLIKQALEDALVNEKRVPLAAVARELECSPQTMRKHFPDLCLAITSQYHERIDELRMLQRLQEVLASDGEIPPLKEIARELGCDTALLAYKFPDLYKQISVRRHAERKEGREQRVVRMCTEIRQATLAFHQAGIYPSARRVSQLLSYQHAILTIEGHATWRAMLEELGYPPIKLH